MHKETQTQSFVEDKKVIRAWALFDWANSAYALVITTAIFPIYFVAIAPDQINLLGQSIRDHSFYSYCISFAYILIALVAPILGGLADAGNRRLRFLRIFTTIGSVACMILFFFSDAPLIWLGAAAFIISTIGYAGSLIFYDAFLPDITTSDRFDHVSATGYAYGYIGSVIMLMTILFVSQKPELFGMAAESTLPFRIGFLMVGLWWLGWSQYTFRLLPQDIKTEASESVKLNDGYKEMKSVFDEIRQKPNLKRFLSAFFFYSAGVNTVVYLATVFAEKELGFETTEMIITVLILQIVAIAGAYLFARMAKVRGSKTAIIVMIVSWMIICFLASMVTSKPFFYVLAIFVGMVLGGIQSNSRASYSKLIEGEEEYNSYFSFYDMLYYVSIVFGTVAFGLVGQLTNNLRYSVLVLALFFVVALIIFSKVNIEHKETALETSDL